MTTPSAKADGFCDHARTSVPRFGRNAQSERPHKDITGGVDITVNNQPAVRTKVNTVSKSFRNIRQASAPGANLRGVVGVDLDELPTSLFHFVGELGKERTPARIVDRTSEHTSGKRLDVQILDSDKAVAIGQLPAEFVLEVIALIADVSVSLLKKPDSFPSPDAAPPASGDLSLYTAKAGQSCLEITRVGHKLTVREGGEGIKSHIDTDSAGRRHRSPHIDNGAETSVPLPSFPLKRQRFNITGDRAVHLQLDYADPLNLEPAGVRKVATIPPGWEGVAAELVPGLEAGISASFPSLDTPKENLESLINPPQHVLAGGEVGESEVAGIPYLFELAGLVVVVKADPLHTPRLTPLLERSIIQGAGLRKLMLKGCRLFLAGIEAILKSPAHLFTFLRFNVMLNCNGGNRPHATDEVRTTPKGRQPRPKFGELLSQDVRGVSLKLESDVRWRSGRVGFQKQVNVVRHHFKGVNLSAEFRCFHFEKFLKARGYFSHQYRTPVFRTPHQVIFQRINRSGVFSIFCTSHINIIHQVSI